MKLRYRISPRMNQMKRILIDIVSKLSSSPHVMTDRFYLSLVQDK